jgi:predicted metal-dependent HD superfamily phosphohydrolase
MISFRTGLFCFINSKICQTQSVARAPRRCLTYKMTDNLENRWEKVWQQFHAGTVPQDVFEELIRAYSSADRFYHNLTHIEDCLSIFDQTQFLAVHPEEIELAIWFHDAVYDTSRNDNEQKSAEWAKSVIIQSGLDNSIAERVVRSIIATRHNTQISNKDAQLMVDVDLSILGREPDVFWRYEENIRKEYAWVPENVFRQKRIEILRGFLDRQYIYYHENYRELFEEKARANLQQAIARLSGVTGSA